MFIEAQFTGFFRFKSYLERSYFVTFEVCPKNISAKKPQRRRRDTVRIKTDSRIVDIPVDSREAMAAVHVSKWAEMAKNAYQIGNSFLLAKAINGIMISCPPGNDEYSMRYWRLVSKYLRRLQKMSRSKAKVDTSQSKAIAA